MGSKTNNMPCFTCHDMKCEYRWASHDTCMRDFLIPNVTKEMSKRKFKPGDVATNGIVEKTILSIQERHGHYLTDVGIIPFENEDKWKLVEKKGDQQ